MGSDSQTSWSTRTLVSIVLAALGITGGAGYLILGGSGKQVQMPIAPVTADADADVIIQSTAATQVPLVVQGAASQSDSLQEWNDSTGARLGLIGYNGSAQFSLLQTILYDAELTSSGLGLANDAKVAWSSTADCYAAKDLSLSRKAANVFGIGDGGTSDAIRVGAAGRIYGNAVTNPAPSATTTTHTTNGSLVTITTTAAHNLCAGQTVTLAGWTWSDGGGSINYTHTIGTVPSTTTFTIAPSSVTSSGVCPTTGTNPSVVGTIAVVGQIQLGALPLKTDTSAVHVGGVLREENNAIATTSTDGIVIANNTPATVGATVQYSPRLRLRGNAWDTDGSNDTWDWWWEAQPVSSTTTTCAYKLYSSKAGAAGTQMISISQSGGLTAAQRIAGADLQNTQSNPTTGTLTLSATGRVRPQLNKYQWTNTMVTALGAVTTGDITVCTLPAKHRVTSVLIVIDTAGTNMGAATLTVQCGTDATFSDYIATASMLASANTVYGDANVECGASLPGGGLYTGHLPSWTATTVVKIRITTDGAGGKTLADVLTSTGTVIIESEYLGD